MMTLAVFPRTGLLWILGVLLLKVSSAQVFLSNFNTRQHLVAGELWLLSDRVLEIRNYRYDGQGPAAFFWIDTAASPTRNGRIVPDGSPSNNCAMNTNARALPAANGSTQRVELPEGTSIHDYLGGSLSVWCERFAVNFGEAVIPTSVIVPLLGPELECFESTPMALEPTNEPIFLSSFTTRSHKVAGDLYLVSDRVLQIRNYFYDGAGPAAFFWIDSNRLPTSSGMVISDAAPGLGCAKTPNDAALPLAQGITQYIELPEGASVSDYAGGSISVWCERFNANFGEAEIPANIPSPPNVDLALGCFDATPVVAPIAVTPEGFNCEPLNDEFQVRWQIDGDSLSVELLGRIDQGDYMGFGLSGRQTETWMIGADAVVADITESGEARVRDIYMDNRSQCSAGTGVCPDTEGGFVSDVSGVSSEEDFGLTLIRYKRPLVPSDLAGRTSRGEVVDLSIPSYAGTDTYIVWAIGPVNDVGLPLFHTDFPSSDVSLDFRRAIANNCEPLAFEGGTSAPTASPPPGFRRPLVGDSDGSTTFDFHIGPSGGPRGYNAITGEPSWGIAWYVNGYLIPKLTLRRGTTYTFRVNGGDDVNDDANHHPLYLTTSQRGGYRDLTPSERLMETPIAGLMITEQTDAGITGYEAPLVAPICRYDTGPNTAATELLEFEDYVATLDTSCASDPWIIDAAAVLTFTPDATTPDKIYYQCVTHRYLGFEIEVIDEDAPAVTLSPTSAPNAGGGVDGFELLELTGRLDGATLNYKVNAADPAANGVDTITVVLEVPTQAWVGFAVSTDGKMVPAEAVIGLPDTGEVQKYNLNARSSAGVVPMPDSQQTLIGASVVQVGSSTILTFTKILAEEGEIEIVANADNTFLSAWGSSNSLGFHAEFGAYTLNLAGGGITIVSPREESMSMWKAHGFLAAIAWAVLTPMAIAASMMRKCLPEGLWFQIHRAFNSLTVVLTIVAFFIAVAALNQDEGDSVQHFKPQESATKAHRTIGLVVFIAAWCQFAAGILRPHLPSSPDEEAPGNVTSEKSGIRKGWEIGHRLFGLAVLGLSWYQVQLGVKAFHGIYTTGSSTGALTAFYVIIGVISCVAIVGFVVSRNR